MNAAVEISMYPLGSDYRPHIQAFLEDKYDDWLKLEGQDQVDDAAAVLRRALDVVGEEREQARTDRPGDQQNQAGASAAVGPKHPRQGAGDGQ